MEKVIGKGGYRANVLGGCCQTGRQVTQSVTRSTTTENLPSIKVQTIGTIMDDALAYTFLPQRAGSGLSRLAIGRNVRFALFHSHRQLKI